MLKMIKFNMTTKQPNKFNIIVLEGRIGQYDTLWLKRKQRTVAGE